MELATCRSVRAFFLRSAMPRCVICSASPPSLAAPPRPRMTPPDFDFHLRHFSLPPPPQTRTPPPPTPIVIITRRFVSETKAHPSTFVLITHQTFFLPGLALYMPSCDRTILPSVAMSCATLLGLIAILFPPIAGYVRRAFWLLELRTNAHPVWVKSGLCSAAP